MKKLTLTGTIWNEKNEVLNWYELYHEFNIYKNFTRAEEKYKNGDLTARYIVFKSFETGLEFFEEQIEKRVREAKNSLGLFIDPYALVHIKDSEDLLENQNLNIKKFKGYYQGKTREYLENPEMDILRYEGEIFLFTPKDIKNTAEINAVRWMGAFGYHSDLTEMLDFEISGVRQRACEIISLGRKNGLEIDPFLTKKSNLNTGFGLLYNEEDINEIFEADVWSDVSPKGNLFSQRNDDQDYSGCNEFELVEMLLDSNWSHTEAFLKKTAKLKGIYLAGAALNLLDKIQKWIFERGLEIDIYLDETIPNRENNPFKKDYNFTESLEVFSVNNKIKIKEERNVYDHYISGDLYGDFFEENRLDLDLDV